jgi:hypothetical protein
LCLKVLTDDDPKILRQAGDVARSGIDRLPETGSHDSRSDRRLISVSVGAVGD